MRLISLLFGYFLALSASPEKSDIVINEVFYHPPADREELQFIELLNRGTDTVDVSGWSFARGVDFTFPANTRIAPGSYLVVCRDRSAFLKQYGESTAVAGNFGGKLSHDGELIELSDSSGRVADRVHYSDKEPWPTGADGRSASLERICPHVSGERAENWAASRLPDVVNPSGTPGRRNDCYSENFPPVVSDVQFAQPALGEKTKVRLTVMDEDGIKSVTLLHRIASSGKESPESPLPMERVLGDEKRGVYETVLDGQVNGHVVRFRIKAVDRAGAERMQPPENEPRPTYSLFHFAPVQAARIPAGLMVQIAPPGTEASRGGRTNPGRTRETATRGNGAFLYFPPEGGQPLTFDHVRIRPRRGGFKIHFQKDRPFRGMTVVNLLLEGSPRWLLSEPLSYELYRSAGVPAPLTEHIRILFDGQLLGYHLLVEQPNESFFSRNKREKSGNVYKVLWYGRGIIGQHEKKTNKTAGHEDLLEVLNGLKAASDAEQWDFIQKRFNVDEVISYFAVSMCISDWDGFHNNYFLYHAPGPEGKWELIPWDKDKTWGDYDGASPSHDWYEMPLTVGMQGDRTPPLDPESKANNVKGFLGNVSWWREGGYFSRPLLANPQFRLKLMSKLRALCSREFTEEKLFPFIDAMETRLEPEIELRTGTGGRSPEKALSKFRSDIQSLRDQVTHRRQFILRQLDTKN